MTTDAYPRPRIAVAHTHVASIGLCAIFMNCPLPPGDADTDAPSDESTTAAQTDSSDTDPSSTTTDPSSTSTDPSSTSTDPSSTSTGEIGPVCGDGIVNGDEACDEGVDNGNGMGCNSDCVASGTPLGEYVHPVALPFCFNQHIATPAVFRDGNILAAGSVVCGATLVELSATLEHIADIELDLPELEIHDAILHEDDWVLATDNCNYRIADDHALDVICDERNSGDFALETDGAGHYIAASGFGLNVTWHSELARFGETSPALGDAPLWNVLGQHDADGYAIFVDARIGPDGSTFVVGTRDHNPETYKFLLHLDALGNQVGYVEPAVPLPTSFNYVAVHPGGELVAAIGQDRLLLLLPSARGPYEVHSDVDLAGCHPADMRFDSTGDLLFSCWESAAQVNMLHKRASDGVTPRWSVPVDTFAKIAFADDNDVVVTAIRYPETRLTVQRYAP
jgi:hypothetical protein